LTKVENLTKNAFIYSTAIGPIGIAEEGNEITNLWFERENCPVDGLHRETALISKTHGQLLEYLSGERKAFDLPLAPVGTDFQMRVWRELLNIRYGHTQSYGEVARNIGAPSASRAVGMANNRNPIAIIIPCHRVIGSNGKLVGFGGGLDLKEKLLDLERHHRTPTD
jgi:methylated-DNA-[protein]-cysteine S-methyltransferase